MRLFRLLLVSAACPLLVLPATTALRHLPLRFEPAADGTLAAREGAYSLIVEPGKTTVKVLGQEHQSASVVTTFAGSNPSARPQGSDPFDARANYLLGSDPSRWRTGVALYRRAVYHDIYPGIDLVFHGESNSIEYDFVVAPGADPKPIALDLSGARSLRIASDGSLVIATSAGDIRWNKPAIYQQKDGARQPIDGAFTLHGRRVTFRIGVYDRSRQLVIDPTLVYATYQGGNDNDSARGVAVDSSGNIYIAGFTLSTNLPHTGGAVQPSFKGGSAYAEYGGDAFVAKYTSTGSIVYVTYLGGSNDDIATAIAVDASGNAYVTGYTASTDFPVTAGAFQTKFGGGAASNYSGANGDAFVTKLNPSGSALVYSTYLGGSSSDIGTSIAVDSSGDAYIGGSTLSSNFPTANAAQATFAGAGGNPSLCAGCSGPLIDTGDGFVTKLNPSGTALLWSTYLGGSSDDSVLALTLDLSNSVYVAGATLSSNFPTKGAYQSKYGGTLGPNVQPVILTGDGFIAKYDTSGNLIYSTYIGGSGDDAIQGIAVDPTGAAYVAGFTSSANLAAASVLHGTFRGPAILQGQRGFVWGDAFAAKLSADGGSLVYAIYVGGSQDDAAMAIAVDSAGEAIIGGFANSTDMQLTSNALQSTFGGSRSSQGYADDTGDAFIAKISADGTTVLYNSYYGGSFDDAISGLAIANGNVVAAGSTTSRNLPVTGNAAQPTFGGEDLQASSEVLGDAFVAIFSGLTPGAAIVSYVVNGASFSTQLAPGTIVDIFGSNLPTGASAGAQIGTQSVVVLEATASEWSVIIPSTLTAGTYTLQFGGNSLPIALSQYAPALFSVSGTGAGNVVATRGSTTISVANPALPGDAITIQATGLGATNSSGAVSSPVTVTLSGTTVTASSVVASSPGVYNISFTVPSTIASGSQNISISIGGQTSNMLTLPVGASANAGPVITQVQNGASFANGSFPINGYMTIVGTNLAATGVNDVWSNFIINGQLPTTLDNVTVTVGGQPAYVEYVSPTQINVIAPNIAPGNVSVIVKNPLGTSAAVQAAAATYQPAFFQYAPPSSSNIYAVATHLDYSYAVPGAVPAKPGETIILWGMGFGPTTPAAPVGVELPSAPLFSAATLPTVTIGGQPAPVVGAAMAQGFASLYQVAVTVPSTLANGDYPIVATVNGSSSPATALISVHQ